MRLMILCLALAAAGLAPFSAADAAPRHHAAKAQAAPDASDCAKPKTWAVKQACKAAGAKREAADDACDRLKGRAARRACEKKADATPALRTATADVDDCAKLKSRAARRKCRASAPTSAPAEQAAKPADCARLKTRAARRTCERSAQAGEAVLVRAAAAKQDCRRIRGRSARRACEGRARTTAAQAVEAVVDDDCERIGKRSARRACEARTKASAVAALRRAEAAQGDCARLRSVASRRACLSRRLTADEAPARRRAPDRRFPKTPPPVQRAAVATPAERGQTIVVQDGDTAFDIAARFGVSVRALAELNGLVEPYDPSPGLVLKVPPRTAATAAASPPAAPRATTRRVEAAATPPSAAGSSSTARPYASLNGALIAPSTRAVPPPPSGASAVAAPGVAPSLVGPPAITTARRGARTEADALAAVAVAATRAPPPLPSDAGGGRFIWPVRTSVISGYGPKGPGLRNDGVDLALHAGDAVRAAADGEVVYAGKEIAAFGNLVLLKHAGGWVTAYAHLGRITVAMRQTVAQGQSIGEGGDSGGAESPRLHFEVRAPNAGGAKPIDPATVLPPL